MKSPWMGVIATAASDSAASSLQVAFDEWPRAAAFPQGEYQPEIVAQEQIWPHSLPFLLSQTLLGPHQV